MGPSLTKCVACGSDYARPGERCHRRGGGFHDIRKFDRETRTFGHRVNSSGSMTPSELAAECKRLATRTDASGNPVKPTLPDVRPLVDAWYSLPGNGAGGMLLHAVLDDHNYERPHIVSSIQRAHRVFDKNPELYPEAAMWLGEVMLLMSNSQRRRL